MVEDSLNLITESKFWIDVINTINIFFIGFTSGVILSFLLGGFIAMSWKFELLTQDIINFVRSIPAIVLLPLLVASMGNNLKTTLILITFVVTFKLIVFVINGFRETHHNLIDAGKIFRLSTAEKIINIYFPSAAYMMGTGLRLTSVIAFGTVIASGLTAGTPGLGSALHLAESSANYPRIYSYVLLLGVIGLLINRVFERLQLRFLQVR